MKPQHAKTIADLASVLFIANCFWLGSTWYWFALTAAVALIPSLYGTRWVRLFGIVLVSLSVVEAWMYFPAWGESRSTDVVVPDQSPDADPARATIR